MKIVKKGDLELCQWYDAVAGITFTTIFRDRNEVVAETRDDKTASSSAIEESWKNMRQIFNKEINSIPV